jgi:hypothetical protein
MPICVWKLIVKIQRHFLWDGVMGGSRKNLWDSWDWEDVCGPKEEGLSEES